MIEAWKKFNRQDAKFMKIPLKPNPGCATPICFDVLRVSLAILASWRFN